MPFGKRRVTSGSNVREESGLIFPGLEVVMNGSDAVPPLPPGLYRRRASAIPATRCWIGSREDGQWKIVREVAQTVSKRGSEMSAMKTTIHGRKLLLLIAVLMVPFAGRGAAAQSFLPLPAVSQQLVDPAVVKLRPVTRRR